jgi:hypothetical protein
LPKEVAANAITIWSKANDTGDLEDLMALMALNSENLPAVQQNKPPPHQQQQQQQQQYRNNRSRSRSKVYTNKQLSTSSPLDLVILGQSSVRSFKYANLNLFSHARKIIIREVHFLYDLKHSDEQFEISMWKIDETNRIKLYNDTVKINSPCTFYRFAKEVELAAITKIWISIEFLKPGFRPSFDMFFLTNTLDMELQRDAPFSAQIISKVVYSTTN